MDGKILKVLKGINDQILLNDLNTNLIEEGLIDSFDIINVISELEQEFDIEFEATDIVEENFSTILAIINIVNVKLSNK